jgi:hypothetical protein
MACGDRRAARGPGPGPDPDAGVAIITEGLLNDLDADAVTQIWTPFAAALHAFPQRRYFSDLHLGDLGAAPSRSSGSPYRPSCAVG